MRSWLAASLWKTSSHRRRLKERGRRCQSSRCADKILFFSRDLLKVAFSPHRTDNCWFLRVDDPSLLTLLAFYASPTAGYTPYLILFCTEISVSDVHPACFYSSHRSSDLQSFFTYLSFFPSIGDSVDFDIDQT